MKVKPPKDFLFKNITIYENDIYKNNEIEVDDCIVDEIKELWEKGIHTCSCCCGHNNEFLAHIMVQEIDEGKMINLGYTMFLNEFGYKCFVPKSKCRCDKNRRLEYE